MTSSRVLGSNELSSWYLLDTGVGSSLENFGFIFFEEKMVEKYEFYFKTRSRIVGAQAPRTQYLSWKDTRDVSLKKVLSVSELNPLLMQHTILVSNAHAVYKNFLIYF